MPRKLEWDKVKEVSVVDAGANLKGRFPITKGLKMADLKDTLEAALETPVEGEDEIKKHAADDESKQQSLVALYRFADACGIDKSIFVDADEDDTDEDDTDEVIKAEDAELDADIQKDDDMNEEIKKQFADLQELVKTEREAREAVEAKLEKAKDEAELAVWVGKCKDNLSLVPGTPEEQGERLHKMAKMDADLADAQFKGMCETNELLAKSGAFEAVGTSGRSEASADERIAKRSLELKKDGMSGVQALIAAAKEAEKNQ